MMKIFLFLLLLINEGISQNEIVILSPRVGTIIDIHENLFYRIFPKVRNFISAQIYEVSDLKYSVRIVANKRGIRKTYEKKMSLKQFTSYQNKVNLHFPAKKKSKSIVL